MAALIDVSDTEWRKLDNIVSPLGLQAALIDVSDTEWRHAMVELPLIILVAALIDVSDTEWRTGKFREDFYADYSSTH